MSKPVSEGDIAGRRREREGGGVFLPLLLPLRLFVLSVGCCLPGKQEGLQREREQPRGRRRKSRASVLLYSSSAVVGAADTLGGSGFRHWTQIRASMDYQQ